jgi:FHA domain
MEQDKEIKKTKRLEMLPERLMRRLLEGFGEAVDRKLGRVVDTKSGLTTSTLIHRMTRLIDERCRDEGQKGRIAPHLLKLKVEWGTHSEAPADLIKELEAELLAAGVDHINDHRYRTLAPVRIETEVDIFTSGVSVDPSFGEFEEQLRQRDEQRRRAQELGETNIPKALPHVSDISLVAHVLALGETKDISLRMTPGGRRLSVGRGTDNDLHFNDPSVSKVHATLMVNREGTLFLADAGSTNGTFINGRRIAYGEARQVEEGDVVGFGDIEVRFRKN